MLLANRVQPEYNSDPSPLIQRLPIWAPPPLSSVGLAIPGVPRPHPSHDGVRGPREFLLLFWETLLRLLAKI